MRSQTLWREELNGSVSTTSGRIFTVYYDSYCLKCEPIINKKVAWIEHIKMNIHPG